MFGFGFMSSAPDASTAPPSDLESYATYADVDYTKFGEESIRILLARDSGDDKVTAWDLLEETDESLIWRATVEGSEWSPFRVKMAVGATKQAIETALLDVDVLLKLDDMTERMLVLHDANKDGKVTLRHFTSKGMFPIAGREFVMVTYATELPDGRYVIASRSLNIENVPAFDGYVRGRNVITGYIIDEKKDTDGSVYCEVTLLAHADLAGYIPASIVNMLGTSATVKVLNNLKEHLEN